MATVVINAQTSAYPSISNRTRVDISTQLDPTAIVASQTDTTVGHPIKNWSFPGLPRTNYIFSFVEIDGSGNPLTQLALFNVVPSGLGTILTRDPEQIEVGTTVGLVAGTTGFTFDGTGGKPDYRGWEINVEEYAGVNTLIKNVDYSWNSVTGEFLLLTSGAVLADNQWYTITFDPIASTAPSSALSVFDFATRIITADETLTADDFGKKLILEPAGNYMEITLPPLSTVISGRRLMVETTSGLLFGCVKFILDGADSLSFMYGSFYMMFNESAAIYKLNRGGGLSEYRVDSLFGNWGKVGQIVSDDATSIFNKVLLNGQQLDNEQFARHYNEFVLNLPISQRVSYDNWSTNKTFYSLADSADPANAGKYFVPDRRGIYERNASVGEKAGVKGSDNVGAVSFFMFGDTDQGGALDNLHVPMVSHSTGGNLGYAIVNANGAANKGKITVGTGKTKVEDYSINKYTLV